MWRRFASTRTYYPSSVFLIFLVPALSDFLFGYDIGATSYSILLLRDDPQWIGFVVSATSAGAFGTSFLVFKIADQIGRRKELQISSLLYLIASLIEAASGLLSNNYYNKHMLILGRIIYGGGIAFGLHGASTYAGEMLPSSLRGACMSCQEVSLVLGILVGYAVGSWNAATKNTWFLLYLFASPWAFIMFGLSICVIPDSARWLLWKRQAQAEAKRALEFVYQPSHVDMELTELTQRLVVPNSTSTSLQPPRFKKHKRSLIAGLGLVTLLQLTGQPTLLSYAASIFGSTTTVWVAVWKVIWTLVAASWVEHFGRKSLLNAGCTIMLVSLLVLTVCINSSNHGLSIGAFFLYILGYQIGFGTMIFVLSLELYPMEIRGPAVAMSIQLNMALNALVQFVTPLLVQVGGGYGCVFGFFSMACAYALYFIHKYIPETKGMTLEEIQEFLADESHANGERNEEQESILTTTSGDR